MLILQNKLSEPYDIALEKEFERDIVEHYKEVFGPESLYIDVKRRPEEDNIVTISDGYLIDFAFETEPRLHIIENEYRAVIDLLKTSTSPAYDWSNDENENGKVVPVHLDRLIERMVVPP